MTCSLLFLTLQRDDGAGTGAGSKSGSGSGSRESPKNCSWGAIYEGTTSWPGRLVNL